MTVTSTSFRSGGTLPVDFTCDGKNTLPSLIWSAPPPNTRALVLIVEDPDALAGVFTHFIAFDLPGDALSIKEGADPTSLGALVGRNDFNGVQYDGPCPPKGEMHHYAFRVFALDRPLHLTQGASRAEVYAAMSAHVLGEGTASALFGH